MPSVPQLTAPTVAPSPLSGGEQHTIASPEILGGGQARTAKVIAGAFDSIAGALYKKQERDDADAVFRAEVSTKDDYIKTEQAWRQSRQGAFAKDVTTDAGKWWDDNIAKQSEQLGNDRQRKLFSQRALRLKESSLASVSHFETSQLERAHDESWAANRGATISMAAATATPEAVEASVQELNTLNRYQAARKGWDGAVTQAAILADTTNLHKQVLQTIAQQNPQQAQEYFEKYKSQIDGAQQAEIGKFAKTATATRLGEISADKTWGELGPKQDADPVELDKMEARVRKEFPDNDFAMKAALAALKERAASHNSSQKEREAGNVNTVMDAVRKGATVNDVRRMGAFDALSGEKRNQIEEHIATRLNIMEGRDLAGQSRAEREQMIKFAAAYHTYSDPDVLSKMTRPQVQALEPTIGRHYTESLLTKWEAIGKHEGALSEARIDNDAFKTIVRDFGFDPDKKLKLSNPNDAKEAARLGTMRDEVERQIGLEQKAKNRVLTREEKDAVARRALSSNVLRSTWFGLSNEAIPAASVIPADLKKIVVPPADRDAIKAELVKRGKPTTDEDIARWYLMGQRRSQPR